MKPATLIIAADPGRNGALAFRHPSGIISVKAIPSTPEKTALLFQDVLKGVDEAVMYLEELTGYQAGRRNTSAKMFVMGVNCGLLMGMAYAYHIPIVKVTPQAWQKGIEKPKGIEYEAWKAMLHEEAKKRYPELGVSKRCADAALILDYAIRQKEN